MIIRVLVYYVLMWFFLMLFGGLQQATGILPPQIGLAQLGPGVAGLLAVLIFRKDGLKLTWVAKQTSWKRYLWAALIPAGVGLVVYLARLLAGLPSEPAPEAYSQMGLVLLWIPFGALGEEIGWRGYLHKKLDTRMRGLVSSIIVGLLWLPMHVHFLSEGPVLLAFLAVWFISLSVVLYALVQDQDFSILIATVFHLAINLINMLVVDVMFQPLFWVINGTAWAILAAVIIFRNQKLYLMKK